MLQAGFGMGLDMEKALGIGLLPIRDFAENSRRSATVP